MLYLGLIAGNPGYAQCNITQASGSSDFPTSIGVGQSFTATCDGTLDYIKIKPKSDGTGFSIVVYEGDGLSGTELVNRSGINIRANGGDFVSIDLSSEGISLTSGSKYTFFINWSQDIGYANGPVYAEGKVY